MQVKALAWSAARVSERQPWHQNRNRADADGLDDCLALSGLIRYVTIPGLSLRSNPGLQLAYALRARLYASTEYNHQRPTRTNGDQKNGCGFSFSNFICAVRSALAGDFVLASSE